MLDTSEVIAAFTEEHVHKLTGLSRGRLRYWDKTGFFAPAYVGTGKSPFRRVYSFRDLVALRTLEMLRVQNNVPLQHLRKVADKLAHLKDELWTTTTLWVLNRRVVVQLTGDDKPQEVLSGQYVLGIPLGRVIADTERDVTALRRRADNDKGRVTKTRGISRNALVIAGTRIRVDSVRRLHEDGYSHEQILAEYPDLTEADIVAALGHKPLAA
ncbi:MAG: DUF433 domain-containing protein [Alphaproteobacteria bacterium]|nr:DUF433 domain-containing protein [Alphaproteobacteria bacterium]